MTTDPRIDDYITKAAPFAQPVLAHLRALIHQTVSDLGETLKWSMPHFTYKGKNLAGFAAFKAHAAFFVHGEGRQGQADDGEGGMGQFGRITGLADLPNDEDLVRAILAAKARIDDAGTAIKPRSAAKVAKPEIAMPDDFADALATAKGARAIFDGFSPSARRDYLEWVVEAKRPETRAKRIAQASEWIAEGKRRNWKYEKC